MKSLFWPAPKQTDAGNGREGGNRPGLPRAVTSVAGNGSGRDMERPEGLHVCPRPEKGISQGMLKLEELFGNLNPFLKLWRLPAPSGCCCRHTEYPEMGTGIQGSCRRDRIDGKGLNNAKLCRCATAAQNRLLLDSALNRFSEDKR